MTKNPEISKGVHSSNIIYMLLVSNATKSIIVNSAPILNTIKSVTVKKLNINCDFFELAGIKKLFKIHILLTHPSFAF